MTERPRLPRGVSICPDCGEARSTTVSAVDELTGERYRVHSTCLCEGRECHSCGERKLRKVGSDYWHLASGGWFHVSGASAHVRICGDCQSAKRLDALGRPRQ